MTLAILAAAILAITFGYIAIRWRKSPKVFKAMNTVVATSIVAGVLTGVWLAGLAREWVPNHNGTVGGTGGERMATEAAHRAQEPAQLPRTLMDRSEFLLTSRIKLPRCLATARRRIIWQQTIIIQFSRIGCIPRVNNVPGFLINLPGANVTDSQVFVFSSTSELVAAHWSQLGRTPSDPHPLESTIQIRGTVFRIQSPEFEAARQGFVALVVSMPFGTPPRMYAVELGK